MPTNGNRTVRMSVYGMDMSAYPVTFDVAKPERFNRSHLFLRLVILIVVSVLGAFAWLIALIYVVIPVLSAAFISRDGSDKFINETAVRYKRYLHWIASAHAYFTLLTDKIPLDDPEVASLRWRSTSAAGRQPARRSCDC